MMIATYISVDDRLALLDLCHRYAAGVDLLDKAGYARCFANEVEIDFGSFDDAAVKVMTVPEWSDYCFNNLDGLDASQHFITNHRFVAGPDGEVQIYAYVQAQHFLDGEGAYLLYGHYTFSARKHDGEWRFCRVRFDKTWDSGSIEILDKGRERLTAGTASRQRRAS